MAESKVCPKCKKPMESHERAFWIVGTEDLMHKPNGSPTFHLPVNVYTCATPNCGYIELYKAS